MGRLRGPRGGERIDSLVGAQAPSWARSGPRGAPGSQVANRSGPDQSHAGDSRRPGNRKRPHAEEFGSARLRNLPALRADARRQCKTNNRAPPFPPLRRNISITAPESGSDRHFEFRGISRSTLAALCRAGDAHFRCRVTRVGRGEKRRRRESTTPVGGKRGTSPNVHPTARGACWSGRPTHPRFNGSRTNLRRLTSHCCDVSNRAKIHIGRKTGRGSALRMGI